VLKTASGESEACSEDGFTQRLTRANMSIFQEETCGNEAMNSYRLMRGAPLQIVKSLQSFDCGSSRDHSSLDHSSYDHSSFDCKSKSFENKSSNPNHDQQIERVESFASFEEETELLL
jgi:hypothetical protein